MRCLEFDSSLSRIHRFHNNELKYSAGICTVKCQQNTVSDSEAEDFTEESSYAVIKTPNLPTVDYCPWMQTGPPSLRVFCNADLPRPCTKECYRRRQRYHEEPSIIESNEQVKRETSLRAHYLVVTLFVKVLDENVALTRLTEGSR